MDGAINDSAAAATRRAEETKDAASGRQGLGQRRFGAVNWFGLWTLYKKEVRRFMKVVFQTVFAPVISTTLFLIVFMQAFGRAGTFVNGTPYIEFLAPGLIMLAILTNSFQNSASSLVIGKVQGSIVDMLMAPLSPSELAVAFVAGAATRGLIVGMATAATAAVFMAFSATPMSVSHVWAAAYFGGSAALMFAMFGVVAGVWADKFDEMAMITNFVITPLTFLSGTFYAISGLPEPFLSLSAFNPVFYLIDGFRYGLTGVAEAPLMIGAGVTLALNVALAAVCYGLLKSGYKLKS
ncbi:MAG: ABC transporter permease [Pseudomonadota bacterium]